MRAEDTLERSDLFLTLKKEKKMRAEDWARIFLFNGGLSLVF